MRARTAQAGSEACDGRRAHRGHPAPPPGRRRGGFGVSETRVNLRRARDLLAERGDLVGQSALSRYVSKYADALDPQRDGRETTIDYEALAKHRSENINRAEASSLSQAPVSIKRDRADEAARNIKAQRELRELDLDQRRGVLVRVAKVEDALASAGEKIVRIVDQLPMDADDLATAVAKGGVSALRLALKEIARRQRTAIADALSLGYG
jgi:hypothetical protein